MCWSIPAEIKEINGSQATVDISGVTKDISLDLVGDVSVGDYVLLHAGYAIQKVRTQEARFTMDFFKGKINNDKIS